MQSESRFAITIDIDWAPDFMIDEVARTLLDTNVRSTWFVTHVSDAVARLAREPAFELGLHPNFLPNSSHGSDVEGVFRTCRSFVPSAVAMRTHATMQSSHILDAAVRNGVKVDLSLFLPRQSGLGAFSYWTSGKRLTRIPYVWTDDYEAQVPTPVWDVAPFVRVPGIQVINFHPVHVWLNTSTIGAYQQLKQIAPNLREAERAKCLPLQSKGAGARSMFEAAVDTLAKSGSSTVSQLALEFAP